MDSFSITYPPRRPEPAEWRWGGPKPDGFRWPPATGTPGLILTCETCWAAVSPECAERHAEWHAAQA